MPAYFLHVWSISHAYTRKEQKYKDPVGGVEHGYNTIHGQNYHLNGDLVLPVDEKMRPGGVSRCTSSCRSSSSRWSWTPCTYRHFSRAIRDFRQALYETGAPSLEYTVGTFIENICMTPMWALFLLVPQIVGNEQALDK